MGKQSTPVNRSRRADRISAWNAEANSGARYRPERVTGTGATFEWIRILQASDLSSTTRHVGIAVALNGDADGKNAYPGVRTLARQTALSQRAVSEHLGGLVSRGFLLRKARFNAKTAGGCGFEYLLMRPQVLIDSQHWWPVLIRRQHGADTRSAVKVTGADSHAAGADANSREVLTGRQPTTVLPPIDQDTRTRGRKRAASPERP